MPRKDYMMRYFEQLGIVLAALLGFRVKGNYKEALVLIRTSLNELPDFYYELVDHSPQDLFNQVTGSDSYSLDKTEMIATLLFEEAEFLNLSGAESTAKDRYEKALLLLQHIDKATGNYSMERTERINRCRVITGLGDG